MLKALEFVNLGTLLKAHECLTIKSTYVFVDLDLCSLCHSLENAMVAFKVVSWKRKFSGLGTSRSLLYADDVVLLVSLGQKWFEAKSRVAGMKVNFSKSVAIVSNQEQIKCHPSLRGSYCFSRVS